MPLHPSLNPDGIPSELKQYPQWVATGSDGAPLNPRTGLPASVTKPASWGTFEEAVATGLLPGFVLTPADPFTIVDLDNKEHNPASQEELAWYGQLIQGFATYAELSKSGRGYHVILRGALNGAYGRKAGRVEVYTAQRYITLTGQCFPGYESIAERQEQLDYLASMLPACSTLSALDESTPQTREDQVIIDIACTADNAEKFMRLWEGDMSGYPSQSEADYALLAMLAYYTPNNAQVRRLFRYSALGKRDKAVRNDKYLNYALAHLRAKEPDVSGLVAKARELLAPKPHADDIPQAEGAEAEVEEELPAFPAYAGEYAPGFIGEVQKWLYAAAPRPVQEVALVAAIGTLAGILGRCYNIERAGLNQYMLLVAGTGRGKDWIHKGSQRLLSAVCREVPAANAFAGPASFASGTALIKKLADQPCFLSVLGEFADTFEAMCSRNPQPHLLQLRQVMLAVYGLSGRDDLFKGRAYADTEKNVKDIQAPAPTFVGETAPEGFFAHIGPEHVTTGFLPRFILVSYDGPRPPANLNRDVPIPQEVTAHLVTLSSIALQLAHNSAVCDVAWTPEAYNLLAPGGQFDVYCDEQMNTSGGEAEAELWNRAHLKAMKLAALAAAATNPHEPKITEEYAVWAIDLVTKDVTTMLSKFSSGDFGTGDGKQIADVRKVLAGFFQMTNQELFAKYRIPEGMLDNGIVPYIFLQRRTANVASLRNDRMGATHALQKCLKVMVETGELIELNKSAPELAALKYNGRMFVLASMLQASTTTPAA